jgi:hypothetical protein
LDILIIPPFFRLIHRAWKNFPVYKKHFRQSGYRIFINEEEKATPASQGTPENAFKIS